MLIDLKFGICYANGGEILYPRPGITKWLTLIFVEMWNIDWTFELYFLISKFFFSKVLLSDIVFKIHLFPFILVTAYEIRISSFQISVLMIQ